jgi:hypothetical protein
LADMPASRCAGPRRAWAESQACGRREGAGDDARQVEDADAVEEAGGHGAGWSRVGGSAAKVGGFRGRTSMGEGSLKLRFSRCPSLLRGPVVAYLLPMPASPSSPTGSDYPLGHTQRELDRLIA